MKTQSFSKQSVRTALKVVKGLQKQHELAAMTNTAWNFANSSLWNCTQFSLKEIEAAKEKIAEFLSLSKDPSKAFSIFCQRVLLARYYVNKHNRAMPLPTVWLDRSNEYGFAGTKAWYDEIKTIRESLPNYKQELKAMAEAVMEFSEEPTVQNYQYWRKYFIDKQTPGLLNLFQVIAIQQICNA
ncbi:MAG: hypothetical protein QM725_01480 [Lacibacter sp.]